MIRNFSLACCKRALFVACLTLLVSPIGCAPRTSTSDIHIADEFYQDEGDAGDDPFVGGCHFGFTDTACTVGKTFVGQDECLDRVQLREWTDDTCHPRLPFDQKIYDCNNECIARGHRVGRCSYRQTACPLSPGGVPPAECVCWD